MCLKKTAEMLKADLEAVGIAYQDAPLAIAKMEKRMGDTGFEPVTR